MTRIGKLPIPVPSGVDVSVDERLVTVKGPKGTLTHTVVEPITVDRGENGALEVKRPDDERESRSRHGLTRTLIANMVTGVTDGYTKNLEISGVGYRVTKDGNSLVFALGFSHPVHFDSFTTEIPSGPIVSASKGQTFTQSPSPRHPFLHALGPPKTSEAAAQVSSPA